MEFPRGDADVLAPFAATLKDGQSVVLRAMVPGDAESLRLFHEGLSERTVYLRFFAPHPHLSEADLEYFTRVDQLSRVALVAVVDDVIIGVGRFDSIDDRTAEVAFVVTDAMQGKGVAGLLLSRLARIARDHGVGEFTAEVLATNTGMIETFRHSGFDVTEHREDNVLTVTFPLEVRAASTAPEAVADPDAARAPGSLGGS